MPSESVPGADSVELRRLAALGALARALAPEAAADWPEPLASWVNNDVQVEPDVIEAFRTHDGRGDLLALTYEYVVRGANRRKLGTFFTPTPIALHMFDHVDAALQQAPNTVVDPGAGVGAFSLAALHRWPKARVHAVDINVVTLGLLAARGFREHTAGVLDVVPADYLSWVGDHWNGLPGPRLVLGNPPYTRHQQMTTKDKRTARDAAGDLITSGLSGLSTYFLASSLKNLCPDDALCLLLPVGWAETNYGRELRRWFWTARSRRVDLHFFPNDVEVFPGTKVTAMVVFVGPEGHTPQHLTVAAARVIGEGVKLGSMRTVDRSSPCPTTFTRLLDGQASTPKGNTVPLGDIANIRRGVATGASDFFFLSDDQCGENRIPAAALRRALVKPAHITANNLTEQTHDALGAARPRWLLDLNGTDLATQAEIATYLSEGTRRKVDQRYLPSHRPHWWAVEEVSAPDLFISPVGKSAFRIIVNTIGAVGSNNFYGIYLDNARAPWSASVLAKWLRSDEGQEELGMLARHYQGGSLKIEPKSLRNLAIPQFPMS